MAVDNKDQKYWDEAAKTNYMYAITCHNDPVHWETVGCREAAIVAEMVQDAKFKTILDFGCGAGRISKHLPDHFRHVIAYDWSQNMLDLIPKNPKLTATTALPARVDVIFTLAVLFHHRKADLPAIFALFAKLLPKGGKLIFQLPVYDIGQDRPEEAAGGICTVTPAEFSELTAAFDVTSTAKSDGAYVDDQITMNHFFLHQAFKK